MQDRGFVAHHRDLGNVAETDVAAVGGVDDQVTDAVEAVTGGCRPLHDHGEDLLLLVEVSDFDALQQRRCRASDIAGNDAGFLRCGEVHLDLCDRLFHRGIHVGVHDARGVLQDPLHLCRLLPQDRSVEAVDPNPEAAVAGLADLVDALLRVGRYLAGQAGVPGNDLPDGGRSVGVGRVRGNGDPQLAGTDVADLVRGDRAADVSATLATPGRARSSPA